MSTLKNFFVVVSLFLSLTLLCACGPTVQMNVKSGPMKTYRPVVSSNELTVQNQTKDFEFYWTFARKSSSGQYIFGAPAAYMVGPREENVVENIGTGIYYVAVAFPNSSNDSGMEYLYTLEILVSKRTEPIRYNNVEFKNLCALTFIPQEIEVDGIRVQRVVEWGKYLTDRGWARVGEVLRLNVLGGLAK